MKKTEFMEIALNEAIKGYKLGEIPVGAVIEKDDKIISSAHNLNRTLNNPTRHAEIIVIENASKILKNERLTGCNLYVTKEPCAMCAGAIIHSRISCLIIGTRDPKYGACGTALSICGNNKLNYIPEIEFGILETKSSEILKKFFQERR